MDKSDIETRLEVLMLTSRSTTDWSNVAVTGGVLVIALAMYNMAPAWGALPFKDTDGSLNTRWMAKAIAALVIVICTVVLVRMLMNSKENRDEVLSGDLIKDLPFVRDMVRQAAAGVRANGHSA